MTKTKLKKDGTPSKQGQGGGQPTKYQDSYCIEKYHELFNRLGGDYNYDCFESYDGIFCFDCGYIDGICFETGKFPAEQIIEFIKTHKGHHIVFKNLSQGIEFLVEPYLEGKELLRQKGREIRAFELLEEKERFERGETMGQKISGNKIPLVELHNEIVRELKKNEEKEE